MKGKPIPFALSMIVKNGVETLPRILDLAPKVWDYVLIVDTGSTDGTVEFLKEKYPFVDVMRYTWEDNFADARNFALRNLPSEIKVFMWLDADDTFTLETGKRWRSLARGLSKRKDIAGFELPYHYQVDEHGNVKLLQYRERIMRCPDLWEWREPLHEVCCYIGKDSAKNRLIEAHPVVHRPEHRSDPERNWRILAREWMKGEPSPRTRYYIQKDLLARGVPEASIETGRSTAGELCGHFEYERLKHLGDAYVRLWERDGSCEYAERAEARYRDAINYYPMCNEARVNLIDFLLRRDQAMDAILLAEELRTEIPPPQVGAVLAFLYSEQYRLAKLAQVRLRSFGLCVDAVENHLQAIDCDNPPDICYENDQMIRTLMEKEDFGIVSASGGYIRHAYQLVERLCAEGVFSQCLVVRTPRACTFGRKLYVHVGSSVGIYADEAPPQVRRVLFLFEGDEDGCVGWETINSFATAPEFGNAAYETIFCPSRIAWGAQDLESALAMARAETASTACFMLGKENCSMHSWVWLDCPAHDKASLYVNHEGKAIALAGSTKAITRLAAENGNTVLLSRHSHLKITPCHGMLGGVAYRTELRKNNLGTVAIYAGGTEPWDGNTPYRWGIGASEASVVYLAEALYKRGLDVTVFTTTTEHSVVAGVRYAPARELPMEGNWDLFISSREPRLLDRRLAKRQLLWMHDVPEKYDLTPAKNMDAVVCVSEWQKKQAVEKLGLAPGRIQVIPNIVPRTVTGPQRQARAYNDVVWCSDPVRGALTLARWKKAGMKRLGKLWIMYGFANSLLVGDRKESYLKVLRDKHALREAGAYIVGRVGADDLRYHMGECGRLIYPSDFPETFCNSVLEAYQCGLQLIVAGNGAVLETLTDHTHPDRGSNLITPIIPAKPYGGTPFEEKAWKASIENVDPRYHRKDGVLAQSVRPERVLRHWEKFLPLENKTW